jgi:hypothetical protein
MREVRGKGVYIRRDTNYNYKSEHFEFMLCEKIMERGSALGEDMLTCFSRGDSKYGVYSVPGIDIVIKNSIARVTYEW